MPPFPLTFTDILILCTLLTITGWILYRNVSGLWRRHGPKRRAVKVKFENLRLNDLDLSEAQKLQLAALALAKRTTQRKLYNNIFTAYLDQERQHKGKGKR